MKKDIKKIAIWSLFGLTAIVSLYLIMIFGFWFAGQNVAYPGTKVAGITVSGKTKAQIEQIVNEKAQEYQKTKITLVSEKPTSMTVSDLGLQVDPAKTASQVISWGAGNPFVLGSKKDFPIIFTANQDTLDKVLSQIADDNSTQAIDPTLALVDGEIKVGEGSSGKRVNLATTAGNLFDSVGHLGTTVKVSEFSIEPSFTPTEALAQMTDIKRVTENPINITDGLSTFTVDSKTLVSWIAPSGSQPSYARLFGDDFLFSPLNGGIGLNSLFSSQKIGDYLTTLTPNINKDPVNAQLAAQNGAVVVVTPSTPGRALDVALSTASVLEALETGSSEARVVVDVTKPEVREDNLADLGIKELVSTGFTNFAGSPVNRIHNVTVGAAKFNGVLIKPNERFSFNTTLGPVDASTGYLPELVILENKTTPEFGGGMCQVSSTAFRAALNAGMPILERLYHAYPVTYYKPYGVDATIYLPEPDLVFRNDTGHYILIQTHIEGTKLTFDFYGTKPNRTVQFAGTEDANGAVPLVEQITPYIYDQGVRGRGSFTAVFWRFIYDSSGKLITKSNWVSKYDSPDKFPH